MMSYKQFYKSKRYQAFPTLGPLIIIDTFYNPKNSIFVNLQVVFKNLVLFGNDSAV